MRTKQYNADDDHPPPKQRQKQQQQQQQQRFTVQFRSPPGDQRSIDEQDAFLNYLEQHGNGLNVTVRYRFHDVLNGMSIQLNAPLMPSSNQSNGGLDNNFRAASTADQENGTTSGIHPSVFLAQTLSSCPYVNRYWPGKRYARPNVERSPERFTSSVVDTGLPNLHVAHSMTTVDRVRVENGLTGKGIKVGILDTGIDYTHPALGGCFGDGCRVAYGYDLVGDSYGETTDKVTPDNDPMDQFDGHGTHVSGIIGAHDTIKGFEGVAPNVTFGAWREMAVKAGMDIINLSLGGGIGAWEEDPLAVALSNIADQGVFVSVAQGNEGRDGFEFMRIKLNLVIFSQGIERTPSPAVGDHVLAVASMDNEYTMSDAKDKFTTNHTIFPIMTIISNQTSNEASLGCAPILNDLTGHIVLLRRGQCEFGQKAIHVQNAGGIGLLVYSDPGDDAVEIDLRRYTRVNIPVASISGDNGTQIFHLLTTTTTTEAKNNNSMTIKFSEQLVKIDTGGLPSM
ncbi:hypothetical protein INT45_006978 [Circinella minor]|uniref:Peptidase S8/S53 domain-containing protein n=1 Tax=Circinella minor TaxID=1195481 RepID=A0A8H7S2C5_9FUNG|nr:hypothetical protein INT45_006978 [Circinella minor]